MPKTVLLLGDSRLNDTYADRLGFSDIQVISELPLDLNAQAAYLTQHGDPSHPTQEMLDKIREMTSKHEVDAIVLQHEEGGWLKAEAIDESMRSMTVVTYFYTDPFRLYRALGFTRIKALDETSKYLDVLAAELNAP